MAGLLVRRRAPANFGSLALARGGGRPPSSVRGFATLDAWRKSPFRLFLFQVIFPGLSAEQAVVRQYFAQAGLEA